MSVTAYVDPDGAGPIAEAPVATAGAAVTFDIGAGQTVKLVNQILVVVTMLGVSEALLFAQAATKTNRPGEAINVLTAQTSADPRNARLQQALGAAYSDTGDDPKAFAAFKKAYELNSKDTTSGRNAVRAGLLVARRAPSGGAKDRAYRDAATVADAIRDLKDGALKAAARPDVKGHWS